MSLFSTKQTEQEEHSHDNRVEIVAHKDATKRAVAQAKEANKHLKHLLDENHFTIRIFIAVGGKPKRKKLVHGH